MHPIRSALLWAFFLAGGGAAQTLDSHALTGKYYFRHLFAASDASGNITSVRSLLGAITFDGSGAFTFTGQQNIGAAAPAALTGSGTYTVNAGGFVSLTNPQRGSLTLNARYSAEAVVGSSTENTDNVFDFFIAIPAPAAGVSSASLSGGYWAAGLELPGGTAANARSSFFLLNANSGRFATIAANGHTPGQKNGAPYAESVFNAVYQLNGDGTGSANFPSSTLVADNKTLYISRDGNLILGGSTAAGAHDLLVAVKQIPGMQSPANWTDKFWSAGLRVENTNLSAFSGSVFADGENKLLLTRRIHGIGAGTGNGAIDFTGVNAYDVAADGSGSALTGRAAIGAGGDAFVAASLATTAPAVYELYVGVRMPAVTGTGVFLKPQGVVNSASFAPAGDPISPGELLTLFGSGLGPGTLQATTSNRFPTSLAGVTVTVNNVPAPLYYVSDQQTAALVPFNLPGSTATIVVNNNGRVSNSVLVPVAKTSPGIFSLDLSGTGPGAITHANFQVINENSPAKRGETILIYLTGLGAVSPAVADGAPGATAEPLNRTTQTPLVHIGDKLGKVVYSGLAPGFPGLYQVNVTIPADAPVSTAVPLAIETAEHYQDQVDLAIAP